MQILGIHYLTFLGYIIIAAGTIIGSILVQIGNDKNSKESTKELSDLIKNQKTEIDTLKEQNSNLNQLAEESRFPIPDVLLLDITVDLKSQNNQIFKSLNQKLQGLEESPFLLSGNAIFLDQLNIFLKATNSKISLDEELKLIADQFNKLNVMIHFSSGKNFLVCENTTGGILFDGLNTQGQVEKKAVANFVYLKKEKIFSIGYRNISVQVTNRFPQFNSLYDFENTDVKISINPNYFDKTQTILGIPASKTKPNKIELLNLDRLTIGTENLLFAKVENIELMEGIKFKGRINSLIDWNK